MRDCFIATIVFIVILVFFGVSFEGKILTFSLAFLLN